MGWLKKETIRKTPIHKKKKSKQYVLKIEKGTTEKNPPKNKKNTNKQESMFVIELHLICY